MDESNLQFSALEAQMVARAANSGVTRHRILFSVLVPVALIALVLTVFRHNARPPALLWLFVGYVAVNMFEKVAYGLVVLSYKSVIRKLTARVRELEGRQVAE